MVTTLEAMVAGAAVIAAVVMRSALGSAIGALGGEVLDYTPYIKHAIPEGMAYLSNFINPDVAEKAKTAMIGNLDKVGAVLGFFAPYIRSSSSTTVKTE